MKLNFFAFSILLSIMLFSWSGCCRNDDAPLDSITLSLQFFNADKTDNLFDSDGPLTSQDVSFEFGRDGQAFTELEFQTNGTILLFLTQLNGLALDVATGADGVVFMDRMTGERDSLFVFGDRIESRCSSQLILKDIEFNGERRPAEERVVIELVLE